MAVVSCNEVSEWSSAQWTLTGKRYTRAFKVQVGAFTDGASVAITAGGLPALDAAHPDDGDCLCCELRPTVFDSEGLWWRVNAHYETPSSASTPKPDPLDDPIQLDWDHYEIIEALTEDRSGTKILNSAEDPFDPPLTQEVPHPELTIVRNVPVAVGAYFWSPTRARDFKHSVNDRQFKVAGVTIAAARLARITKFAGRLAERNAIQYYIETICIAFNMNTWDRNVLDQGLNQIVGGVKSRITLDDGNDAVSPQLLDGAGARLAVAAPPVYGTFQTLTLKDFKDLALPENKDGT